MKKPVGRESLGPIEAQLDVSLSKKGGKNVSGSSNLHAVVQFFLLAASHRSGDCNPHGITEGTLDELLLALNLNLVFFLE